MKKNKSLTFLVLFLVSVGVFAQNNKALWQGKGRIAISSDGNEHDDDDWSATPMSLAMLHAAGLGDKLALYTYSDHVWGSSQRYTLKSGMSAYDHMKESALVGQAMFGFKNTRFICAVDNAEVAYNALRDEINQSSETNPLIIVLAGPMQVIGEAINRSNKELLKYVTILSHSDWNENHSDKCHSLREKNTEVWDVHSGWTWEEVKAQFETIDGKKGVTFVRIEDQNSGPDKIAFLCDRKNFDWIKTSPARKNSLYKAGSWDWLYSRLEVCLKGEHKEKFDISDAGMIVYLITGNEKGNPDDMKMILENPHN